MTQEEGSKLARDFFSGDDGYDPEEIYTASRDEQGHSGWLRVPVPTHWMGQIEGFAQSKDWPEYSSKQAFARDAIYHHLHRRQNTTRQVDAQLSRVLQLARMNSRLNAAKAEVEAYKSLRDNIDDTMNELLSAGSQSAASRIVEDFMDEIESHEEPYRSKLLNMLLSLQKRIANNW